MEITLAGTGHRSKTLGGYSLEARQSLGKFLMRVLQDMTERGDRPVRVISGMALGFDQQLAVAAINLGIPVTAAIPFPDYDIKWPQESRDRYNLILSRCNKIEIVSELPYQVWKLQTRNEWMVDNSTHLLALWNGSKGGTCNCVEYALEQRLKNFTPIKNIWGEWQKWQHGTYDKLSPGMDTFATEYEEEILP